MIASTELAHPPNAHLTRHAALYTRVNHGLQSKGTIIRRFSEIVYRLLRTRDHEDIQRRDGRARGRELFAAQRHPNQESRSLGRGSVFRHRRLGDAWN